MPHPDVWELQPFLPQMLLEVSTGYYMYLENFPNYYYIFIYFFWLTIAKVTKGAAISSSAKR